MIRNISLLSLALMAAPAFAQDVVADAEATVTPDLAAIAAADPMLDVRMNAMGEVDAMVMLSDVLFEFNDATLQDGATDALRSVAESLRGVEMIAIKGHTDAKGGEDFNLDLGQRRADAVRDWLVANTDLTADGVRAIGVGEVDPIAANFNEDGSDNPDGRALNRRVEFSLEKLR